MLPALRAIRRQPRIDPTELNTAAFHCEISKRDMLVSMHVAPNYRMHLLAVRRFDRV